MTTEILIEDVPVDRVTPYYQDAHTTIYHAGAARVLANLPSDSVGAVLTDPVYTNYVYVCEWEGHAIPFDPKIDGRWITDLLVWYTPWVSHLARITSAGPGWVFLHPHYVPFLTRICRFLEWPAQVGYTWPTDEVLLGLGSVEPITAPLVGNQYGSNKSIALLSALIRTIPTSAKPLVDPFMGNGSSLMAARLAGWDVIGMDYNEACCERAATALQAGDTVCLT